MDEDSSAKFIGSLTKFLQSLCNGYVEFSRGVELVGHIYLNIDTGEKVDYILHERVCKNDENSVSFTSNSFHAQQPGDKKAPADKNKSKCSSARNNRSEKDDDDDDNDIMIVDDGSEVLGSTNRGTVSPRKHAGFHGSGRGPTHRQGSMNPLPSPHRNRQAEASATVTSRDTHQENINIGNVKLEQISNDELLSLTSHVGEGSSQGGPPKVKRSSSFGDAAGQPVWVKQELPDDQGDTGWSQSRDGQSDTSNSGSDLYPVMMHQNPGYSSGSVFPGFSSVSGHNPASGSRLGHSQPLPGMSGAVDMYGNPMPGTSHGMGGMDPAELMMNPAAMRRKAQQHQKWLRLKQDPERYAKWKELSKERMRKFRWKKKLELQGAGNLPLQPVAMYHVSDSGDGYDMSESGDGASFPGSEGQEGDK